MDRTTISRPARPLHKTHFNQLSTKPISITQQSLRDALFMKQKQLLAARLGHSNIPIEPLKRQVTRLQELLEEEDREVCRQKRERDLGWVVVPSQLYAAKEKEGEKAEKAVESPQRDLVREILEARRAKWGQLQKQVPPGNESDPEKMLGTWI